MLIVLRIWEVVNKRNEGNLCEYMRLPDIWKKPSEYAGVLFYLIYALFNQAFSISGCTASSNSKCKKGHPVTGYENPRGKVDA